MQAEKTDEELLKEATATPAEGAAEVVVPGAGEKTESDKIRSEIKGLDNEDAPPPPPPPKPVDEERNLVKKLRGELEETNKKLRALEAERTRTPPPPPGEPGAGERRAETPPPARTPETIRDENAKTFRILDKATRALAGEVVEGIDGPEQAQALAQIAQEIVGLMSPEELAVVLKDAEAGAFGANSRGIAELVRRESSPALMREHLAEKERRAQAEIQKTAEETVQKQLDSVYTRYPALTQREEGKESAEYKYSLKWFAENVGTAEKPGLYYGLGAKNPELIGKIFDRMMMDYEHETLKGVKVDRDRLSGEMARIRNPESGGRPGGESRPARESDALRQQIIEKAGITDF